MSINTGTETHGRQAEDYRGPLPSAVPATPALLPATAGATSTPPRRWVRIAHVWGSSARVAGATATAQAVAGPDPRLLMVFASFTYDLSELLAGVAEAAGEVPVIGCSTAGEIGPGPEPTGGAVIVCLGGDFTVRTACAVGLQERPRGVGEDLASALLPLPTGEYRVVIMLTDALAGDQQEMIRGAYSVLGATVPLVGGGAGDDLRMVTSRQFHGGRLLQNAVVAACIGTDSPIGLAIRHGWHRRGDAMVVTATGGNCLYSLDDRPALDVYLDRHDAPAGVETDRAAFAEFALTRPLAVARRGDVAVRHVLGADPEARSLICAGSVPKGAAVWLARGDVASTLAATEGACAEAVAGLGGVPLLALLVFDCAGRRALLGDDGIGAERLIMRDRTAGAPVAGFYTYGEVARTKGVSGFHNQTIVALALS